jgi:hypothetical protein
MVIEAGQDRLAAKEHKEPKQSTGLPSFAILAFFRG